MTRGKGTWPSPGPALATAAGLRNARYAPESLKRAWILRAGLGLGLAGLAPSLSGCQPTSGPSAASVPKTATPAKVTPVKEADLGTITLTPEAETRLGLALGPVERKPVPRVTTYGGEVMVPSGRLIVVASPFNGSIRAPKEKRCPGWVRRSRKARPSSRLCRSCRRNQKRRWRR